MARASPNVGSAGARSQRDKPYEQFLYETTSKPSAPQKFLIDSHRRLNSNRIQNRDYKHILQPDLAS